MQFFLKQNIVFEYMFFLNDKIYINLSTNCGKLVDKLILLIIFNQYYQHFEC